MSTTNETIDDQNDAIRARLADKATLERAATLLCSTARETVEGCWPSDPNGSTREEEETYYAMIDTAASLRAMVERMK